jgi:hypothetical protein
MENKMLSAQEELNNLKVMAYDLSKEVTRLTEVLRQVNARVEQVTAGMQQPVPDAAEVEPDNQLLKKVKAK